MKPKNNLFKITFLFFIVLIYACKDDSTNPTNNNNNNNNSNSGNIQYFFDIEIGGVQHKIEGNAADINYSSNWMSVNKCYQTTSLGSWSFQFSIDDRSAPQYKTGESIGLTLQTDNTKLGQNSGTLNFGILYPYLKSFFESKNIHPSSGFVFVEGKAINRPDPNALNAISNIQLTDLGTPSYFPQVGGPCSFDPNNLNYCWGETVKGSYAGTLFFRSKDDINNYSVPIDVSIKFAALRMPQ